MKTRIAFVYLILSCAYAPIHSQEGERISVSFDSIDGLELDDQGTMGLNDTDAPKPPKKDSFSVSLSDAVKLAEN